MPSQATPQLFNNGTKSHLTSWSLDSSAFDLWFATWFWPHQGANEPDRLSLWNNCDKQLNAGYGRCQIAFPEALIPCGPWQLTLENHHPDAPQRSLFSVQSENLPRGLQDGGFCQHWVMTWGGPGTCMHLGGPPGGQEERTRQWPLDQQSGLLLCSGLVSRRPHRLPQTPWLLTWRQQGQFLPWCYSDSASRWTQEEGGTPFSTQDFPKQTLGTSWSPQRPRRLHLASPVTLLRGKQNRNVYFVAGTLSKSNQGKRGNKKLPMAGNGTPTLATLNGGSFNIKGNGQITAIDQF